MHTFFRLLLAAILLSFAIPVMVHAQNDSASSETAAPAKSTAKKTKAAKTKTPESAGAVDAGTSSPATVTSPASSSETAPTGTATSATAPAIEEVPEKSEAKTVSVKAGKLEISRVAAVASGDGIDLYMSIKNEDKIADVLSSAETSIDNGGVVLMTKGKDGKETEVSSFGIEGDKTSELSSGGTWLRIKNVKKTPKGTLPLELHFRRSPNAHLAVEMKSKTGSFLKGIFGQ